MDNAATAVSSLFRRSDQRDATDQTDPADRKKAGVKDTTVDETVAPAVTNETVTKTHEEKVQNVVEKERHQDHYHTTIQPLKDREVQPEQHEQKVAATQEKNINRDDGSVAQKVNARENDFSGSKREGATIEKRTQEDTIEGEHVHHHLHETVQPVIEKETVKPSVTHTTVPIKERYQEQSVDHGVTKNAPMSVDQFEAAGNVVDKAQEVHKEYAGAPKLNESKD